MTKAGCHEKDARETKQDLNHSRSAKLSRNAYEWRGARLKSKKITTGKKIGQKGKERKMAPHVGRKHEESNGEDEGHSMEKPARSVVNLWRLGGTRLGKMEAPSKEI